MHESMYVCASYSNLRTNEDKILCMYIIYILIFVYIYLYLYLYIYK